MDPLEPPTIALYMFELPAELDITLLVPPPRKDPLEFNIECRSPPPTKLGILRSSPITELSSAPPIILTDENKAFEAVRSPSAPNLNVEEDITY